MTSWNYGIMWIDWRLIDMLDGNVFAVFTREDDIIGLHAIAEKYR